MAAPDPSWKDLTGYLWAVLLIPVGMLWKKADGALSREEFEKKAEAFRDDIRILYKNAEADRAITREAIGEFKTGMHDMENRLRDKIDALK